MYWDRFDIVEAHYTYCMDWHGGQWSPEYAKLCRISRYFKPGTMFQGFETLSENGKEIYEALVRKHQRKGKKRK